MDFFYIKAVLFLILEVVLWYAAGTVYFTLIRQEKEQTVHKLLAGFIVKTLLFSGFAIVLKLLQTSLTLLAGIWLACLALIGIAFLIIVVRQQKGQGLPFKGEFIKREVDRKQILERLGISVVLIFVMAFIIEISWSNGTTGSIWDESYYIGDVSTSVYTDTISTHDPYTGDKLERLNTEYFFETHETHSAVISRLLGIHPILTVKYIQTGITGILYFLILYAAGMVICKNQRKRAVVFPIVGAFLLYYGYGWVTQAGFFFARGGEGKSLQALVIAPLVFYQFLKLAYGQENKKEWLLLFLILTASFGLNMSSLFLLPAIVGGLAVSMALVNRNWRYITNGLICGIPFLFVGIIYLLMSQGILTIYVR